MRIAFIVPSLIKSGPIKVVHQLVEELQKEHLIEIFYFKIPDREKLFFEVPVHQIKFIEAIDFDAYDIIHSHTILPDAYIWYHRNKIKKAKTVTTLHSYAKEELGFTYGEFQAFFIVKAWNLATSNHDQVVVLSKNAVNYYKQFWHNKNIVYVYNGVADMKIVISNKKDGRSEIMKIGTIASAGGINRRKGIDQIIKAMPKLEDYELYIAGKETDETANLKQLAKMLGVLDRIYFLGYVDDMASFIKEMDLFVVSPRSEGFSLALQEIVRYKKPVVCSDVPIFRELFSETEVKFFMLNDIESLVEAIRDLSVNGDALAGNAYKKFLAMYTADKMAENYLNVYNILQERRTDGK